MASVPQLTESVEQELSDRGVQNEAPIQLAEEQLQVKEVKVKKARPPPPKPKLLHVPGKAYIFDQGFSEENLKEHVESVHHLKTEFEEVKIEEEEEEKEEDSDDQEEAPEPLLRGPAKIKIKRKYNCCKTSLGQLAFGQDAR